MFLEANGKCYTDPLWNRTHHVVPFAGKMVRPGFNSKLEASPDRTNGQ
jgi:hypothetical protein